jgi:membrane fusion protein
MSFDPGRLFRREAIDHQYQRLYSAILLPRMPTFTLLAWIFVAAVAVLGAFFCTVQIPLHENLSGRLVPERGLIAIYARERGIITSSHVAEGQRVKRGDLLFVTSSDKATLQTSDTLASIERSIGERIRSLEQDAQRIGQASERTTVLLRTRIADTKMQLQELDLQIRLQATRSEQARKIAERYRDLEAQHFVPNTSTQEKTADDLAQQLQLSSLRRSRLTASSELRGLQDELAQEPLHLQSALMQNARDIAELREQLARNDADRNGAIVATADGFVTNIVGRVGQTVSADLPLLEIVPPDSALEAEVFAPSRAAGVLKAGMPVAIRYAAFPYQRYGQFVGWIKDISAASAATTQPDAVDSGQSPSLYRVRIRLRDQRAEYNGQLMPLKAGAQLEATALLEKRTLWQWATEPVRRGLDRLGT